MHARVPLIGVVTLFAAIGGIVLLAEMNDHELPFSVFTEHEAGFEPAQDDVSEQPSRALPSDTRVGHEGRYTVGELRTWQRSPGTTTVALQVGHLRNDAVPAELANLTQNGAGATWGRLTEREVVREIAQRAAERLRSDAIVVDILPTTIPPGYYADAFVSIHADGSSAASTRGYKTAHFSHDYSGQSPLLEQAVNQSYASSTGLPQDSNVTYYMTGYYAFNWWRYEHALHPMTPAMILETGFITNARDRDIIVRQPERAAAGIAEGVRRFLASDARDRAERRTIRLPQPPFSGTYRCLEGEWDANDPADERGQSCRPGVVTENGGRIGLYFRRATSTVLQGVASGTPVTVDGDFQPMRAVRDLSWYDYQVHGVLRGAMLQKQ